MNRDPRRAATMAVLGAAAFAIAGACIKQSAVWAGNEQIVFIRSLINLVLLLPWAWRVGGPGLRTTRPGGHLWRAGLGLAAMSCFFYAIPRLPLAEAMLLNYSSPLYLPFIAWLWIAERPPPTALAASLLGLAGVVLIVKPGFGGELISAAALVGWFSGLLAASAMVGIRRIADTEPVTRIVFYFAGFSTLLAMPVALLRWQPLPAAAWPPLLGTGLAATLGQLALTRAYALAPAAFVAPFTYSCVLFSALLAWVLWGEGLDPLAIIGGLIVVLSCVVVGLRPRHG